MPLDMMRNMAHVRRRTKIFCSLCVFASAPALAEPLQMRNGITGGIDTPNAYHKSDATTSVSLAFDDDVRTVALAFQALPWLETSLSFTTFDDIGGGISQDNTALNLKLRLLQESRFLPTISLGVDDLFSNTRESAEYIVASKSFGNDKLRTSLGVGWGRLGGYDTVAGAFADRPVPATQGRAEFGHLFKGDAALFGGVEWDTPLDGLTLAVEYSSASAYGTDPEPESRFNYAAKYAVAEGLDLVVFNRNGTTSGLLLNFYVNPKRPPNPPDIGNVAPLAEPRPQQGREVLAWANNAQINVALRQTIEAALAKNAIKLERFATTASQLRVGVSATDNAPVAKVVGRTVRVLSAMAPPSVTSFEISTYLGGLPGSTITVPRDATVALANQPGRGRDSRALASLSGADPDEDRWTWAAPPQLGFSWNLTPALSVPLDSAGRIEPDLTLFADARYDLTPSFYVAGTLSYLLAGDKDVDPAPAAPLPSTDGGSYDRTRIRLDRLYGAFDAKVSETVYGGLTFGLLEREYRGISAEALWIPNDQNWALGAELTYAEKRDYEDPFGSLDFDAVTGFVSLYWDTGYKGLSARVDAGRYLAGDWGTTLSVSRSFANGWEVTGYTTLTEDNRDERLKLGARVSIPLSTLAPVDTQRRSVLRVGGNFGDAGARVSVPNRLMGRVKEARNQRIEDGWSEFWN